jgi:phosphatidate cytidylyltransferase
MVPDGEERGGKFEDLFEDLDKFFSQGNPADRPPSRAARPLSAADKPDDDEGDLLPPGWEPDIEGLDLGSGPPPSEERDSIAHREGAAGREPDDRSRDGEAEETEPEATGEMTGEDWTRLRGALGEGQRDEPDSAAGRQPAESAEDLFGPDRDEDFEDGTVEAEVENEDRHELSLEDLKKAPPEYEELPRAEEIEGAGDREATGRADVSEVEGDRPAAGDRAGPVPPAPEEPYWDEPDMADVEAAADNLAASMGGAYAPGRVEEELLADIEEEPEGPRTVRVGGVEPLTGPTWEEPTSRPVMPEQAPPEPGRNLPAAVLTAAVLAAVALFSLAFSKALFAIVAGAVVLLGQAELYATMQRKGHQPATALGLVIGGFTLAGAYLKGEQAMAFFLVLGLMLSFLWYMAAVPKAREGALEHIGSTLLGVLYVPFLAGFILVILAQPESGRALMLAVLGLTFVYDIAAFVFGSFWGTRSLAPTISPKKSWEGLFGATVVTFALAVAILPSIDPLDLLKSVGLAIIVAVFAPLGDLAESAIKRDLGVKDMGSVLPGHGGVLDRIDSVLFVAPAAFYYLRLVF